MATWQQFHDWVTAHGWWLLALAILFEIAGTTSMKLSDGLTRPIPSILLVVCYLIAFSALALSLKTIDMGIAYAIWAGVGTALAAIIGFLYFREPASALKVTSIAFILMGVIGLHYGDLQHRNSRQDPNATLADRSDQ
jgi:small multidrug resistance pump